MVHLSGGHRLRRYAAPLLTCWLLWNAAGLRSQAPVQFLAPVPFDTGEILPVEMEQGDFNGDGLADIAVRGSANGAEIAFLLGDGAGRLLKENTLGVANASGFTSGDFNGDGLLDLAFTQASKTVADTPFCNTLFNSTVVLLRTAAGAYVLSQCLPGLIASHALTDAASGDFNGDGALDLVVTDRGLRGLRFYAGRGDGTFGAAVAATNNASLWISAPVAVDVDRDRDLDVVARSGIPGSPGGVATFFNNGSGQFTFASIAVPASLPQRLGILAFDGADVDGDGTFDLVGVEASASAGVLFVARGSGNGVGYTLSDAEPFPVGNVASVRLTDFNQDGALDVAAVHQPGNALHVYLGVVSGAATPAGTIDPAPIESVGVEPLFAAMGDWNRDGWPDIAVVDRNGGQDSRTWMLEQVPPAPDTTPPVVDLTEPIAGAQLLGIVVLSATASDVGRGIATVEFYADGVLVGADTTAPYTIEWDTTTAATNGGHTLAARAIDKAGNAGTSGVVTVTVDNTDSVPPTVSLDAPPAGSIVNGQVLLSATAADDVGVTKVEFYAGTNLIATDSDGTLPFSAQWDANALMSGTYEFVAGAYTLTAKAYDAAGNSQSSSGVAIVVDRAPTANAGTDQRVEATSAAGASVTLAGSGTDSDSADVLSYRWTENGAELATTAAPALTLTLGTHQLQLTVTDTWGLSANATVTISVRDTTAPALTLPADIVVEATSAAGATVTYTVSASDVVDADVAIVCAPASGSAFAIGATPVTCRATDDAANVIEGSFSVTVAALPNHPPTVDAGVPQTIEATSAAGGVVSVVGVASDPDPNDTLTFVWSEGAQTLGTTLTLTTTLPLGTHTLLLTVTDAAGASASGSVAITVRDTTAPAVNVTCPASGSTVSGTITVCAVASDAVGVQRVEFLANGAVIGSSAGPTFNVPWDTTAFADGTIVTLSAIAYDASGLTATAPSITVTVRFTVRLKPPGGIAPSLPEKIRVRQLLEHQFRASGSVPLTWSLPRGPAGMRINRETGVLVWTPTPEQVGTHRVVVRVENAAGRADKDFEIKVVDAVIVRPWKD